MRKIIIPFVLTFLLGCLLGYPSADAQVYKWIDDKGVVNFTDDPNKVPDQYRSRVEKDNRFVKPTPEGKKKKQRRGEKFRQGENAGKPKSPKDFRSNRASVVVE